MLADVVASKVALALLFLSLSHCSHQNAADPIAAPINTHIIDKVGYVCLHIHWSLRQHWL